MGKRKKTTGFDVIDGNIDRTYTCERRSRSQRKADASDLFPLAERLWACSDAELASLPISDALREAIALGRNIKAHGALRRQSQYVAKLLRAEDIGAIEVVLDDDSRELLLRALERWRERILSEQDAGINAFIDVYPQADRQQLRQLARHALSQPKAARTLFQLLRRAAGV